MLSRAFRERGRVAFQLGGFFACNVVRRHARGCGAAATSRALGAAADQRSRRDSGRSPRRRRRTARFCGVRRRTVRSRSGRKRYVQRVVSGRCAVRESRRLARTLGDRWALQGNLCRVADASGVQDDLSGPLARGEASAAVFFFIFFFGGGSRSRWPRALATWIRPPSPETTDRDSAQRWP